jgi:hypothetical protein
MSTTPEAKPVSKSPSAAAPAQAIKARAATRRRWSRRIVGVLLGLVIVFLLLTRSPITRQLVLPVLGNMIGAQIEARSVEIRPDGTLIINDMRARAPGVAGPAGIFAEAKRVVARTSPRDLLTGRATLVELRLEEPVIRVSQSIDDERLNIAKLKLPDVAGPGNRGSGPAHGTDAPAVSMRVPLIFVERGRLELGEHDATAYRMLKRIDIAGAVTPSPTGERGGYDVSFRQLSESEGPFAISGEISPSHLSLKLGSVSFADWPPSTVPAPLRRQFAQLQLEGRIKRGEIEFPFNGRPVGRFEVEGVALNLPVEADTDIGGGGRVADIAGLPPVFLRMKNTSGIISLSTEMVEADLRGSLEDLPYAVKFTLRGTELEYSPFDAELVGDEFNLGKDPKVLRFVGDIARKRLREFGPPQGLVTTKVKISRGEPTADGPAEVKVAGDIYVREATAAFHKFPYPFHNISGHISFSDEAIVLNTITGEGAGGSKLSAVGRIAPPTDEAAADVRVHVTGAPIDAVLEDAMGPRRQALLQVFSDRRHEQLLESGLVISPRRAAELRTQLEAARSDRDAERAAEIEKLLETPVFPYRGLATIDVSVIRHAGPGSSWDDRVKVELPEAGALPEKFPFPLIGRNVKIDIFNDVVTIEGGTYEGLLGGTAQISATADIKALLKPDEPFAPDVRIEARDVPSNPLLINAIALAADRTGPAASDRVRQILTDLNATGLVGATTTVGPKPDGTPGFESLARIVGLAAAPAPGGVPARVALREISGDVRVTDEKLLIELSGELRESAVTNPRDVGSAVVRSTFIFKDPALDGRSRSESNFSVANLNVEAPVEDLVAVLSPNAATKLRELRAAHAPAGVVNLAANVQDERGEVRSVDVRVDAVRDAKLTLDGERYGFTSESGSLTIKPPVAGATTTGVAFDSFRTSVTMNAEPAGIVNVVGGLSLGAGGSIAAADLTLAAADVRLESALSRRVLEKSLGPRVVPLYDDFSPTGAGDVSLSLKRADEQWTIFGRVSPKRLEFTSEGRRVTLAPISGSIELIDRGGRLVGLHAHAPEWSVLVDGDWGAPRGGGFTVDTRFSASSTGYPADLRAALPDPLRDVLDQLDFRTSGAIDVSDGVVKLAQGPDGARTFSTTGVVALRDAAVRAGIDVDRADGTINYRVTRQIPDRPVSFDLAANIDRMHVAGISMTNGVVNVRSADEPGLIVLPRLEADCHGGRFSGEGTLVKVTPNSSAATSPSILLTASPARGTGAPENTRPVSAKLPAETEPEALVSSIGEGAAPTPAAAYRYDLQFRLAAVRFAPVLADIDESRKRALAIKAASQGQAAPAGDSIVASAPLAAAPATKLDPDSRGLIDANLSLTGLTGIAESRSGRLNATIGGGEVASFPLLVPLIRFSNLQLPVNETIDNARLIGYIQGPMLALEHVSVATPGISIAGYGTVSWPEMALDLELNSRSNSRIPVVSWALEAVRDELISTRVGGTLAKPDLSTRTLSSTSRLLDKILGRQSERDQRMESIERESVRDPLRVRIKGRSDVAAREREPQYSSAPDSPGEGDAPRE